MKLKIKRIQSSDIGAVRAMAIDFMGETNHQYPAYNLEEIDKHLFEILSLQDNPEAVYLIAYDGKKPAGFFTGYVGNKPYTMPARVGVAAELYVVPEKRGGVVALKLMEEAAKLAIEQGAQGLECIGSWEKQADGSYAGTATRWEKFGFKPHVVYGHMDNQDFMALVQRFTRRVA